MMLQLLNLNSVADYLPTAADKKDLLNQCCNGTCVEWKHGLLQMQI